MIPMVLSLFLFGFDFYELHILFPSEDKKRDNVKKSFCIVIIVAALSRLIGLTKKAIKTRKKRI